MRSRTLMMKLVPAAAGVALSIAAGCASQSRAAPVADLPPAAPREFRAAWVATVDNIDWPTKKGLPSAQQQAEIIAILDRAAQLKLNCLIVQIRTSADALYPSRLEPWSVYLSGTQGVPPNPLYDPLKMWVDEGHKRGIEIHAWFNPYRARAGDPSLPLAASHIAKRRPDLVKSYGPYLWLDPGEPEAAKQSVEVFDDVVRRYDIDGIHIDDYFYPYPVKAKPGEPANAAGEVPFPDDASWAKYKRTHPVKPNPATAPADVERVAREDWRRQNVDDLVEQIYRSTKKIKPWVKFGISPFGIGRPNTAPGISGFDQYSKLYADAAMWLNKGWCDYFTPQLYWPIEQKAQSFPVLVDYWVSENKQNRHIWPGMFTGKVNERPKSTTQPNYWNAQQIVSQINIEREKVKEPGHVHFSMKVLMKDDAGLTSALKSSVYTTDALVPASPWLDDKAPAKPAVTLKHDGKATHLTLKPGAGEATWVWAIWKQTPDGWKFQTAPGATKTLDLDGGVTSVVVTAVDRVGNESDRVTAK